LQNRRRGFEAIAVTGSAKTYQIGFGRLERERLPSEAPQLAEAHRQTTKAFRVSNSI